MAPRVLPSAVLAPLQAVSHVLLVATVRVHAAWRAVAALWAAAAVRLAAAAPPLRPLLAAVCTLPPREHIGSRPLPPRVLGIVVAEELSPDDWPAATDGLGALLAWAQDSGFELALLFEPSGQLQRPPALRQLELQLLQRRLHGVVQLQAGWQAAAGGEAVGGAAAASGLSPGSLRAVLLAAADSEWPLLAVAGGAAQTAGQQQQHMQQRHTQQLRDEQSSSAAAIDAAIAAPARLRHALAAAAGPLAAAEPDFVLVTGPALTLAGFPPWEARAAEIYGVGPLAALAGRHGRAALDAALRRFCGTKQRWGR